MADEQTSGGCPVEHGPSRGPARTPTEVPRWPHRMGRSSWVPGSRRLAWFLGYGLPGLGIRAGARRGDPIARLTVDPDLRRDPYPGYEAIRARGALVRGRVVTATVDHGVAREVLRSPHFAVGGEAGPLPPRLMRLLWSSTPADHLGPVDPPSMLAIDGPLHVRHRRLVSRAFAAKNVREQEDRIREVADRLLTAIERDGGRQVDLVARYASLLPVAVIADMLGIDARHSDELLRWGDRAAMLLDPDLTWAEYRRATAGVRELHSFMCDHLEALRRQRDDSLLGRLVQLEGDEQLDDLELRSIALLLLGAGFETTVNLIGNAIALLDANPEQREAVRDGDATWLAATEEALRVEPPVQLTVRIATTDTELAGERVAAGQGVLTLLGGANRDPSVFTDPARFDVTRPNAADHLSLSHGAHYCIGANLARLEGAVALEMLDARLPQLRLTGDARRRPNRVLRGWDTLPATFGGRPRSA